MPYEGKLWWWETLANLANNHEFVKFTPAKIYLVKNVSYNKIHLHYYWNTPISILKYFNCAPMIAQVKGLPEPTSSFSNVVPPKAIELANSEVKKLINKHHVVLHVSTTDSHSAV